MRANVHASQPGSPKRVKNVWRKAYRTQAGSFCVPFVSLFALAKARACCFLRLEWSTWPFLVGADHTQPNAGFCACSQRVSRTNRTRGVIGITRRAAMVLPAVTSSVPFLPLSQFKFSQRKL